MWMICGRRIVMSKGKEMYVSQDLLTIIQTLRNANYKKDEAKLIFLEQAAQYEPFVMEVYGLSREIYAKLVAHAFESY